MGSVERLTQIDRDLFLAWTNWGPESVDLVFGSLSSSGLSYAILLGLILYASRRWNAMQVVQWSAMLIAAVALSDWISVHGFKNVFERLRPCHDPEIQSQFILAAKSCGGRYGFVSSHSSTVWAAFMVVRAARPKAILLWTMGIYAFLVSYSRIYLGVHYPGDVLAGALLGICIAQILVTWRKSPTFSAE
ncbi:MAG: phosphatase PAP2 family protein [Schleiferiaceae bacterium]|nr:phosphatase PAP2 family protein [Schleiferiaceae bacterium]